VTGIATVHTDDKSGQYDKKCTGAMGYLKKGSDNGNENRYGQPDQTVATVRKSSLVCSDNYERSSLAAASLALRIPFRFLEKWVN